MTEKWEYRNATRIYDEAGIEVAQVSAECGLKTMRKRARLITSAPELLEALEEAHLALLNSDDSYAGSSVCHRNQDLIDKAKGKI